MTGDSRAVPAWNSTDNEYLVTWRDDATLYGRRMNASGVFLGDAFVVNVPIGTAYDIDYNPLDNEFLAVWDEGLYGTVYGLRLSPVGTPLGSAFEIPRGDPDYSYVTPLIAFHSAGHTYLTTFQSIFKIYSWMGGQYLNQAGVSLGSWFAVDTAPTCPGGPGWIAPSDVVANPGSNEWLAIDAQGCPSYLGTPAPTPGIRAHRIAPPAPTATPSPTATATPTATSTATSTLERVLLPVILKVH